MQIVAAATTVEQPVSVRRAPPMRTATYDEVLPRVVCLRRVKQALLEVQVRARVKVLRLSSSLGLSGVVENKESKVAHYTSQSERRTSITGVR